ncbi:Homeobox domain and Homeodomain-like and Homeodomain, metazoa-containing protein [Aphelenchoides bicaudatus]|nr:Homeobox domain and Homeodomain-like and Homeodomain, metazoa-containing protein [Aphelenchoides bicaudatus]
MSNVEEIPDYCQALLIKGSDGSMKRLLFPKNLDLNRPKRPRTTFSNDQLKRLDAAFEQNPYLVGKEREKLAKDLGLSETQVKVWYQNKRTKLKKTPQSSSDSEHEKNSNSDKSTPCNNNNIEPPKTPQFNQFPQMPDFAMFPMQQWLFNPNANFQPNDNKPVKFCSNFFC